MDEAITSLFKEAEKRVANTRLALEKLGQELGYKITPTKADGEIKQDVLPIYEEKLEPKQNSININNDIYQALLRLSEPLANSYKQVHYDLNDTSRISWGGTAHEIRQIVVTLLEDLAPDEDVKAQPDYKLEQNAKGPTQKTKSYLYHEKAKCRF